MTTEAKRAYAKKWREENKEKMRAYRAVYRERNRELLAQKRNAWLAANREHILERKRIWYRENKEKSVASARHSYYTRKYGITPEEAVAMFEAQGSVCKICKSDTPGSSKNWHVDHCHSTGKVRGILCNHCNLMLGYAKDNQQILCAAIEYLQG